MKIDVNCKDLISNETVAEVFQRWLDNYMYKIYKKNEDGKLYLKEIETGDVQETTIFNIVDMFIAQIEHKKSMDSTLTIFDMDLDILKSFNKDIINFKDKIKILMCDSNCKDFFKEVEGTIYKGFGIELSLSAGRMCPFVIHLASGRIIPTLSGEKDIETTKSKIDSVGNIINAEMGYNDILAALEEKTSQQCSKVNKKDVVQSMEKELYNIITNLRITIEEDCAAENTESETVKEIDNYFHEALQLWGKYKKDCGL